jgi:hypothetical protein
MKHLLYLFSLLIFPAVLQAQTYQEVKIHTAPENIRTIASLGIAVEDGNYKDGIWHTFLTSGEVKKIKAAGFEVDILQEDYSKYISDRNKAAAQEISEINRRIRTKSTESYEYPVPQHFGMGSMGGYYTPDEVLNELDSMYIFYPNLITQKTQTGTALTVEGRTVYYVKISNHPGQTTNKPKIFYNALTHAREPMGMQQLIFFMWYLLENYNTDAEVKYLVDNLELYFIPVINPDGYAYNYQTDPGGGGMWRKNRRDDGGGNYGVDLNRNFGYEWGYDDQGSSPNPWDETYRGPSPFSESETQDVRDFCDTLHFKFAYNFHTYDDLTMYPWCYITQLTPDSVTETTFTDHMLAKNGYVSGTPGHVLYNTNGDASDWEYGEQTAKPKIISFTTETGNNSDGFWPPVSRIIPLAEENMYANLQAANLTLPYPEITDIGPVITSSRNGYFPFQVRRIGLMDSTDFTVSVKPLDSLLFVSVGSPKVIHYPARLTDYTDSIQYNLINGIQVGQPYRFIYQVNDGTHITNDTITKYFGWPLVLISDSCNNMNNWTSPKWNVTSKKYHSAPSSITDSPNGYYNNNTNYAITLKSNLTLQTSPVAVIEYWVKYNIEKSFDYVQFSTSLDNGATYTKQATRYTNNGSVNQDFPNPVYDGNQWDFAQDRVVLQNTSGKQLLVKFLIRSDGNGIIGDGLYFDDFKVSIVDMSYNGIDPTGQILGFISNPIPNPASNAVYVNYQLPDGNSSSGSSSGSVSGSSSGNTDSGNNLTTGNSADHVQFQLFDSRGIILKEIPITTSGGKVKFNVSDLPSGVYLYRITGNFGSTAVKKLAVAH